MHFFFRGSNKEVTQSVCNFQAKDKITYELPQNLDVIIFIANFIGFKAIRWSRQFFFTILRQNFINNLTECKWFLPCQVICNQLSKFRKFDVDFVHLACMNCVGPTLFEQDHRQVRTAGTHDGQHPNHHDKCAGTDDGGADHQ